MKNRTEFWAAHAAAVKRETISASAYARQHDLSIAALYYWQRKLKSNTVATEAGHKKNSWRYASLNRVHVSAP